MGVDNTLKNWRPLLKPLGYLVFSELLWLDQKHPSDVTNFFQSKYPAMGNVETNIALIEQCGYGLKAHFTLPNHAWWDDYNTPLEAKLPALLEKYENNEHALGFIKMTAQEIEMRRRFRNSYGYEFFIAQVAL